MTTSHRWQGAVTALALAGVVACGHDADAPPGNTDLSSILRFMTPARKVTETDEELGSVRVSGRLAPEAAQLVIDSVGSVPIVLMVIGSSDCFTCEDLGRQLREVVRLAPTGVHVVVATNADGLRITREFLRRERINATLVFGVESLSILDGVVDEVPTPAVLLGRSATDSLGGVAHETRVANVRLVSFAEELGLSPR